MLLKDNLPKSLSWEVDRLISVVPSPENPGKTINTLGKLKPIIGTPSMRQFESLRRRNEAEKLVTPIRNTLSGLGLGVEGIFVTGSAASDYSHGGSDLDLAYKLTGPENNLEPNTAAYFERDLEIDIAINKALIDLFLKSPFAIDLHLANNYRHPDYLRALAVFNSQH